MGKILEHLKNQLSAYKKEIIIFLLIFLISSLSFGLGYLVNQQFNRSPIIIEKCSE